MKEKEASEGTRLHAVIIAMITRTSFATSLSRMDKQSDASWDRIAEALKRGLVEAMPVPAAPLIEGGVDQGKRHESTVIVPECPLCGEAAILDKGGPTTLMEGIPFVGDDKTEHYHDPNTQTGHWVCPNKHEWREEVGFQCGCGWKGKPWTHSVKILKGE